MEWFGGTNQQNLAKLMACSCKVATSCRLQQSSMSSARLMKTKGRLRMGRLGQVGQKQQRVDMGFGPFASWVDSGKIQMK